MELTTISIHKDDKERFKLRKLEYEYNDKNSYSDADFFKALMDAYEKIGGKK